YGSLTSLTGFSRPAAPLEHNIHRELSFLGAKMAELLVRSFMRKNALRILLAFLPAFVWIAAAPPRCGAG
ncbi:MAG: hypothetical protein ACRD36_05690, partial [Candidatus Acidiferrum sp.]